MRFAIFVDGSNLMGSFRHLNIRVNEYQKFFDFVFHQSIDNWKKCLYPDHNRQCELKRVYWYGVGSIDDIDLSDPKTQSNLQGYFKQTGSVLKSYLAEASKRHPGYTQEQIFLEAWKLCFDEFSEWYAKKKGQIEKFNKFYYALKRDTDFIDVITSASWKVDLFRQTVNEKGLDTTLAVDMVALRDNYDVAILISGDADNIPSLKYVKSQNKSVGVVEFLKGYPPEKRGMQSSSNLKQEADFVVQLYEMEMISKGIGEKQADSAEL